MANRKRVSFHYDSEPDNGKKKITMDFYTNVVITNDGNAAIFGPNLDVLGYAPNSMPIIAAKECLEEMLAIVNTAING